MVTLKIVCYLQLFCPLFYTAGLINAEVLTTTTDVQMSFLTSVKIMRGQANTKQYKKVLLSPIWLTCGTLR